MKLYFFCPRWGSEQIAWNIFLKKVRDAGYNGIEWGISSATTDKEADHVYNLLEKYKLNIILQHWETDSADFSKHLDTYLAWLDRISKYNAFKINSHTGKDYFHEEQNMALVNAATGYTAKTGIKVVHETHRNRFLFAAHIAKKYLTKFPSLRLTLDISHWVTVAESYLSDQQDALKMAFKHTDHLHARIGHIQSPQVSDPRLPQWREASDIFFNWWCELLESKKYESAFSITPEFGPYPYMALLPSLQPVSNQWELNAHMMEELKKITANMLG